MQFISITDIPGVRIGQAQDAVAGTGVTALVCPEGMPCGIDIRGGGPASRDTRILDPLANCEYVHAVLLAGGSAFGLDAAGGAMRYLEERGIGVSVGDIRVPLVCQSDIFDLAVGSATARPTANMAYEACVASEKGLAGNYRDGNEGVGCGATVGKLHGSDTCMKSGIGSSAYQVGDLMVGALVVVNALGDVVDPATGHTVAGMLSSDKQAFCDSETALFELYESAGSRAAAASVRQLDESASRGSEVCECTSVADINCDESTLCGSDSPDRTSVADINCEDGLLSGDMASNTTIGVIVTNAQLSKAQLCKVASMGHDGIARTIRPVHTSIDGDSLYAVSVGQVSAPLDVVGSLAARVVQEAILSAVKRAQGAFGLPAVNDLALSEVGRQ